MGDKPLFLFLLFGVKTGAGIGNLSFVALLKINPFSTRMKVFLMVYQECINPSILIPTYSPLVTG